MANIQMRKKGEEGGVIKNKGSKKRGGGIPEKHGGGRTRGEGPIG